MIFDFSSIRIIIINALITIIALTFHELAHGWVSGKLGDPTPKLEGRMTLNPLAHLDVIGTILMILTGFGWAKPVMVNPMYYKDKKKGMALVAVAGPLMNILLGFLGVLVMALFAILLDKNIVPNQTWTWTAYILRLFIVRNLCFAVFNFIPIPPLDGSRLVSMFLPDNMYYKLMQFERYGIILIMVLSIAGVFDKIIGTGVNLLMQGMVNLILIFA